MNTATMTPSQKYNWFGDREEDRNTVQKAAYDLAHGQCQVDWKPLVQVAARIATANGISPHTFLGEITLALLNATGEHEPIVATLMNITGGGNG